MTVSSGKGVSFTQADLGALIGGDGITYVEPTISVDINTTNLQFTASQINTIQDITTASNLQFNKLGLGAPPVEVLDISVGNILAEGVFGVGNVISASGAGTRLMWYPRKAAFRAGKPNTTSWDDGNIGNYSFSVGQNNLSSAIWSFSAGVTCNATAPGAFACGVSCDATNDGAFALGNNCVASGRASMAMGFNAEAQSFASVYFGRFNTLGGNPVVWIDTEPLLVCGNGTSTGARANAFTVFKDGNAILQNKFGLGAAPVEVLDISVGNILSEGVFGAGDVISASGSGARLMWYVRKAAFRAGQPTVTGWDDGNIGEHSFAIGLNNSATNIFSFSGGSNCTATGQASIAFGTGCLASGNSGVSLGNTNTAAGFATTALGFNTFANANAATAMGTSTRASAQNALTCGFITEARSFASVVFGRFNTLGGTVNSWVATEPLLICGNGTSAGARADAFTVFKDGNAVLQNNLGVGDITAVSRLHVFEDTVNTGTTAGVTIEQDGTGDALCQFLLTAGQRWVMGINSSDSDSFTIASSVDLESNARFRILTDGSINIPTAKLGVGVTSIATSAALEISSTIGALLLSSMTTIQRDALTPVNGMMFYNLTTDEFNVRRAGAWREMSTTPA